MRITVVYDDVRMPLDVKPDDNVAKVKRLVYSAMASETMEDKKVGKVLELKYGGAPLQEQWILQDIGITSGSNIKCTLKTVEKPKLIVYLAYNQETITITEDIDPINMKVGDVRSMLSSRLGIPVSAFRLSYNVKKRQASVNSLKSRRSSMRPSSVNNVKELYDMNTLDYYGIEIGANFTLDVWDGWNELIMSAIAGHEEMVMQYFSWEKPVRYFQQRVALYIAAHYGHMGLATAMLKRGAKGHEPVGIHPFRKWCYETEHPETQRCPLHMACAKGHLPILRLFVKHSPLCFITKDERGRTPFQIVLRNRHRSCFEFLIARQWGRKTCNDFTFSMSLYCRIMQWCEKAKAKALLMHGTQKSTFKGFPQKEGALVGTSVLVDGFSKKPVNSVPYALVPKPPIPPENMVFALALTKRKLRAMRQRRSSSRIISRRSSAISMVSENRRERIASSGTVMSSSSSLSFDKLSVSDNNDKKLARSKYESALLSNGNIRSTSPKKKNGISGSFPKTNSVKSIPQLDTIAEKKRTTSKDRDFFSSYASSSRFADPSLSSRKNSKISFKANSKSNRYPSFAAIGLKSQNLQPTPAVKKPLPPFSITVPDSGIPLPSKRTESQLKPFFYWSPYEKAENPVEETMEKFRSYRGVTPHQNAIQCLTITSSFTEKRWLEQFRMAVSLTKRGVRKNQNFHRSLVMNA